MRVRLILILLFSLSVLHAQSDYAVGFLPEFTVGTSLSPVWVVDMELASRFELAEGEFGGNGISETYFSLVDVTTVFTRTLKVDDKLGLGHLARFEDNRVAHRFIQQYSITSAYYSFRIGHRFRTDQTFSPLEGPEYRLRYRIASDIAINGTSIDPREFYIKIGNEYVYSIQGQETDLEVRLIPALGFYLDKENQLEFGLDYRFDSFVAAPGNHRFWINVGYYLRF